MDKTTVTASEPARLESKYAQKTGAGSGAFNPGLRFKLITLVVSISLISVLVSTLLLFSFQRRQLIDNAQSAALALSGTIEIGLHHAMLTNDWTMVEDIIQAFAAERTLNRVRILNTQGMIGVSTLPGEVGVRLDRAEPACQLCHSGSAPIDNRTIIFTSNAGDQVLLNVNLIQNQPECHTCHSPEIQTLGLLMVEAPLTHLNEQLARGFWQTALLALATFGLLISLLVPALNRYVFHPVEVLSEGVAEISAGNLDYPVQAANQDELGALAESFESMRRQLKTSYEEMEQREQEATTLYKLGTKISASLALNEVLDAVAEAALELLAADVGVVGLLDEERQEIVVEATAGMRGAALKGMRLPVGEQSPGRVLVEGSPVMAEVYDPHQPILHDERLFTDEHIASFLAVPLQRGERLLGLVEVLTREPRRFLPADAQLLLRLAHHVVVSLENVQLHRQVRYLAALEERDRLAREMHDRLAQALGFLNVKASMTGDLLTAGRIDQVQESLVEMKKVTKIVYTDVREAIFNLRTSVSPHTSLLRTLQDYLAEYQACYGLDAQLVVGNQELVEFPPEVASQLLYIIQEALTNVRKHAGAKRIWILFIDEGDRVAIRIEDDGRGFSLAQTVEKGGQRYGLYIMRERAQSVGGSLDFDSQPGRGTRVIVRVPSFSKKQ